MFFEKRHNQGASGKVYPFAITEGIEAELKDQDFNAVYIENEFNQLIVLPKLGDAFMLGWIRPITMIFSIAIRSSNLH